MTATSGNTATINRGDFFAPVLSGRRRMDLLFRADTGPNADKSWTVTDSGVDVDLFSLLGGVRQNIADETNLFPVTPISNLGSAVMNGAASSGDDATGFGAVKDIVLYEQLDDPNITIDLSRSAAKDFPCVIVNWIDSEPADGTTTSQTDRAIRVGVGQQLYHGDWQISIIVNRAEGDDLRREEGLYILDLLAGLITDKQKVDGCVVSSPSGVHVKSLFRLPLDKASVQRFYAYGLTVSTMYTLSRTVIDESSDWAKTVIDATKPQDPALPNQGDYPVVGDGSPGTPGVEVDMP